jgi:hypothetical protein
MKRILHTSTMLLGSLLSAGLLAAGSFSVPFEFEASGKTMPAGSYQVERMSATSSAFRLLNRDSGKSVLLNMPISVEGHQVPPKMVFRCAGGDCSVAEVWTNGVGAASAKRKPAAKPVVVDASN